jgi:preprotein translocase subunit SecD
MRQRTTYYTLIAIVVLFLVALAVDASNTLPGFPAFAPGVHQGVDLQGGLRILYQAVQPNPPADSMTAARDVLERRVNGTGVSEPVLNIVGNNRISVELPGVKNPDAVASLLGSTGNLTINDTGSTYLNPGTKVDSKLYPVQFTGKDIKPGSGVVAFDQTTNQPVVDFALNGSASDRFAKYTADHVGQHMAIAMDNIVVTDPVIQQAIPSGQVQISGGNMDYTEANNIALQLKYGALPIAFKVIDTQQIAATLGPANVHASINAGLIGLLIVVLFMLIYYRLPGLLADIALLLYAAVVFAIFKLLGVTLTLAGIAGFILSIGMAVDANVLIFERLKEELRFGKTLGAAIDAGFARAWTSIRDSNISTMLTCLVLFWFGQTFAASIIVGFAETLFIGVAVSMFTAIFVTRTFLRVLIGSSATRRSDGTLNRQWFGAGL